MDYKDRVRKAIENFTMKQDKIAAGPKRKNLKPEKEVEKECLKWMRDMLWDVQVIESKSTYDPRAGRYISQSLKQGHSDISGNTYDGLSVYIELKAPGKLSTLRDNQREFLIKKINSGCFAGCVDGVTSLETLWNNYNDALNKKQALLDSLPSQKKPKDRPWFDLD